MRKEFKHLTIKDQITQKATVMQVMRDSEAIWHTEINTITSKD